MGVGHLKLVPFVASGGHGPSQPVEVLGNLLLFVPFGVHIGSSAPACARWRAAAAATGASATLEVAHYVLAVGSTDLTDVIVNTADAVSGSWLSRPTSAAIILWCPRRDSNPHRERF